MLIVLSSGELRTRLISMGQVTVLFGLFIKGRICKCGVVLGMMISSSNQTPLVLLLEVGSKVTI